MAHRRIPHGPDDSARAGSTPGPAAELNYDEAVGMEEARNVEQDSAVLLVVLPVALRLAP